MTDTSNQHPKPQMTQAASEVVEAFKRELALALRQITGRKINIFPEDLPTEVKSNKVMDAQSGEESNIPPQDIQP